MLLSCRFGYTVKDVIFSTDDMLDDTVALHILLDNSCSPHAASTPAVNHECPPPLQLCSPQMWDVVNDYCCSPYTFKYWLFSTWLSGNNSNLIFIRSLDQPHLRWPSRHEAPQGMLMRVVNTILYEGNFWLAWTVDESTGVDFPPQQNKPLTVPTRFKQH